jgi:hypothetical protein
VEVYPPRRLQGSVEAAASAKSPSSLSPSKKQRIEIGLTLSRGGGIVLGTMWPWDSKTSLKSIEEHLIRLETRMKSVEVEWEDAYEKIRRTLARINHRYGKVEAAEAAHKESVQQDLPLPGANGQAGRLLTERQKELQQQILRRRAGGN